MLGLLRVSVIAIVTLAASTSFALGLSDPPPAGFKVVAMFTNVRAQPGSVAASVSCTNFDKKSTNMRLEAFGFNGEDLGDKEFPVGPGETRTISTELTSFFLEDNWFDPGLILNQGSLRVLSSVTTRLICTGYVLSTTGFPPAFMQPLRTFDKNGK